MFGIRSICWFEHHVYNKLSVVVVFVYRYAGHAITYQLCVY